MKDGFPRKHTQNRTQAQHTISSNRTDLNIKDAWSDTDKEEQATIKAFSTDYDVEFFEQSEHTKRQTSGLSYKKMIIILCLLLVLIVILISAILSRTNAEREIPETSSSAVDLVPTLYEANKEDYDTSMDIIHDPLMGGEFEQDDSDAASHGINNESINIPTQDLEDLDIPTLETGDQIGREPVMPTFSPEHERQVEDGQLYKRLWQTGDLPTISATLKDDINQEQKSGMTPDALSNIELLPAWRQNSLPAPKISGRKLLSLVLEMREPHIDDVKRLASLSIPATIIMPSFSQKSRDIAPQLRKYNFESLMSVPLQSEDMHHDVIKPLGVKMDIQTIKKTMSWHARQWQGYVGFSPAGGDIFLQDIHAPNYWSLYVKTKGVLIYDNLLVPNSTLGAVAKRSAVPLLQTDVKLPTDNVRTDDWLDAFEIATKKADKYQKAVIYGSFDDNLLEALAKWITSERQKDYVFVPATTIIKWQSLRKNQG